MHLHKYEKIWLGLGGFALIAFLGILGVNAFAMGSHPPSHMAMVDPTKVDQTPPFDKPGLVEIGDNEYDLNMTAFAFGYGPAQIEIPKGAKVHFNVTSKDVAHGFSIPGTNVNMMVLPGHVNSVTHTFDQSGDFLILCNEYCGVAHHMMMANIVVK